MEPLLRLKDFSVTYQNKDKSVYAVRNVDLTIKRGESIGVVGESGSGKTTLAMGFLRLLPEKTAKLSGQAEFLGHDLVTINRETLRELRWMKLSVVFQKAMNSFSPVHRIGKQIEDIYRVHVPKASAREIKERVLYLLKLVNLPERVYAMYPHEASGGMIQRVSIAASLLHSPELLVMDEATTALDVITQGQILNEVVQMERALSTTRLMITHDISVVSASCKKIAVMYAGNLLEVGETAEVLKNPLHPYTKGLLASFPSLKGAKSELRGIEGSLPDLSVLQEGCAFEPRCSVSLAECKTRKPSMQTAADKRSVACFRCGGGQNA